MVLGLSRSVCIHFSHQLRPPTCSRVSHRLLEEFYQSHLPHLSCLLSDSIYQIGINLLECLVNLAYKVIYT